MIIAQPQFEHIRYGIQKVLVRELVCNGRHIQQQIPQLQLLPAPAATPKSSWKQSLLSHQNGEGLLRKDYWSYFRVTLVLGLKADVHEVYFVEGKLRYQSTTIFFGWNQTCQHTRWGTNPQLVRFSSQRNVSARLDWVQTLSSALNDTVCYVCIVWDVANWGRHYLFTVTHLNDSQSLYFSLQYQTASLFPSRTHTHTPAYSK